MNEIHQDHSNFAIGNSKNPTESRSPPDRKRMAASPAKQEDRRKVRVAQAEGPVKPESTESSAGFEEATSALEQQQSGNVDSLRQQFYIEVDASTVANLKAGAQYTLVPVESDQIKVPTDVSLASEAFDSNKVIASWPPEANKSVYLQMPASQLAMPLTQAACNPIPSRSESVNIIPGSECVMSKKQSTESGHVATSIACQGDGNGTTLLPNMIPTTAVKIEMLGKADNEHNTPCSDNSMVIQHLNNASKDLMYTSINTKDQNQQHGSKSCVHFETPRGYLQQSSVTSPATPMTAISTSHPMHRPPTLYTSEGTSNSLGTPYPHSVVPPSHPRGQPPPSAWSSYIQSTPSPQIIYTTSLGASLSAGGGSATSSVASSVTLNSSGEEGQDSSPDYPKVPHNTPNSAEMSVDVGGSVQKVTVLPEGQQLTQFVGPLDNMRYFVPFSGRENHNEKERKRRSRIKNACQTLRSLVPGLSDKTDKATVFEFTVQYLMHLKRNTGVKFDKEFMEKYSPY